jgi:hypothetical protein
MQYALPGQITIASAFKRDFTSAQRKCPKQRHASVASAISTEKITL